MIEEVKNLNSLPSPGSLFLKKRQEYGWSVTDVARELLLSTAQVEALEKDQYSLLPGATYIIGYWRSYSNLLKIDIADSINEHKANLDVPETRIALEPNHQRAHGHQEKSRRKSALLFCLLSIVFLSGIWFWQNPEQNPLNRWMKNLSENKIAQDTLKLEELAGEQDDQQNVITLVKSTAHENSVSDVTLPEPNFSEDYVSAPSSSVVEANSQVEEQDDQLFQLLSQSESNSEINIVTEDDTEFRSQLDNEANQLANEQSVAVVADSFTDSSVENIEQPEPIDDVETIAEENLVSGKTEESPEQGVESPQKTAETQVESAQSVSGENILEVNIEQQTWLDIRDGNGEKLIYRTVETGEALKIEGRPPFYVFIGAASGVKINYLGEPVEFTAHKSGLFARFKIGE